MKYSIIKVLSNWSFPGSSAGKESVCNAGDPNSIPGSGRSREEGIGYSLWYSWASLVAQMVKNPPAMPETWVWSLDWGDSLEKGIATHSSILAWRIPWTDEPGELQSMGSQSRSRPSDWAVWSLLRIRRELLLGALSSVPSSECWPARTGYTQVPFLSGRPFVFEILFVLSILRLS